MTLGHVLQIGPRPRRLGITALFMAAATLVGGAGCAQSNPGSQATAADEMPMNDRIVLVTGSTDGLGREVAVRLGDAGAHVIVHGRNRERGEAVAAQINAGPGTASFYAADFGSLAEVRSLAARIAADFDRLDLLVNNAGIWAGGPGGAERLLSADGHELHFQVNYLAHYLLTELLTPLLIDSAPARIVNVASAAQTSLDFDNVMLERGYGGSRAYGQSKLAQILMTVDLAQRLGDSGITVVALHPATLMDTELVRDAGVAPRTSIAEGADAVMRLATGSDVENGGYYNGQRFARADAQAYDAEARERLRALSRELTGLPVDADR